MRPLDYLAPLSDPCCLIIGLVWNGLVLEVDVAFAAGLVQTSWSKLEDPYGTIFLSIPTVSP